LQDSPLKAAVKLVARIRYLADLKLTRRIKALSGEPHYRLVGSCNRCGQCCRTPVIPVYPLIFYLPFVKRMVIAWHRAVNGFELIREVRREGLLVFSCTHWDRDSRLCDAYKSRPGMCRDYPGNLVYAADPELFETCGYRAVLKNASQWSRALDEADLPVETREQLKASLHILPDPVENHRRDGENSPNHGDAPSAKRKASGSRLKGS